MVQVPARLEFATATTALANLDQALRGGADCTLDLGDLAHFDSSALAVLLELRRRFGGTAASAGRLAVINPPAALRTLAEVYGVDALLFGPGPGPGQPQ